MAVADRIYRGQTPATGSEPRVNLLVDRFGREHTYLRISVTDRCNLRCTYCMPAGGIDWKPREALLTFEEIERVARVMAQMGVQKIRLTGGEPMVRSGLENLVERLSLIEGIRTIAMTTNGLLLADKAALLKARGLSALNISLDTLRRDRFTEIARIDAFNQAKAGLDAALATGFESLKLNVVVMAGVNDDEILDFVDFAADQKLNVRFIEYMPFKDNRWEVQDVVGWQQMKTQIETRYALEALPTELGAVAKDFQIVGHTGTVSFISSMTDSFCDSCNRLRITADGQLKSCLFHPAETNLRDVLRSGVTDAELETHVTAAVLAKPEAHPPMEELLALDNRSMIEIGG